MRYRQCLTKGMTLIKMYAVTSIKSVGYEVYKQAMAKVGYKKRKSNRGESRSLRSLPIKVLL